MHLPAFPWSHSQSDRGVGELFPLSNCLANLAVLSVRTSSCSLLMGGEGRTSSVTGQPQPPTAPMPYSLPCIELPTLEPTGRELPNQSLSKGHVETQPPPTQPVRQHRGWSQKVRQSHLQLGAAPQHGCGGGIHKEPAWLPGQHRLISLH